MRLASSAAQATSGCPRSGNCPEPRPDGQTVKAKVFEVILHKLASGNSPASALEEQLNAFLIQKPSLRVVATHMNTIVAPAEPNAMPKSEEASIIIFCTLFYAE